MTRPRKTTVDWFPHSVNHGRTMFTLEKRYGLAGYCFWFKLLEVLGNTEGHLIDIMDPASLEFLAAYTYTDKETCLNVLNLLSTLDAIDPKLWKEQVVWSDNFITGIAAAYRNRKVSVPGRPDNYRKLSGLTGVSNVGNPGREGREGRKGRKEKDIAPPGPSDTGDALIFSGFYACKYFEVDFDYRLKLAKEYPAVDDALLRKELSKAEDWISDNAQRKKFKANGQLANPKLFIKNWLDKLTGISGPGKNEPKGFAGLRESIQRRQNA
jgi:hypothetical protein